MPPTADHSRDDSDGRDHSGNDRGPASDSGAARAGRGPGGPPGARDVRYGLRRETPAERDDRNLAELLQELRVTQTGVQILFAFLLTLAFTPRFEDLDETQRTVYVVTLLLAMLASVLFTAPVALHRGLFQRGRKRAIVHTSSRLATTGMGVLALAFTGSLLLVVDVVEGRAAGIAVAATCLVLCGGLWGALPVIVGRVAPRRPHAHEITGPHREDHHTGPTASK